MQTTKYTNDGKKVLIVGQLNSQETIVQEIFVAQNGQEIPSGENFVVKSLHDTPVESWKEKRLRELEASFEKDQKTWGQRIESQSKRLRDIEQKAKLKTDSLFSFVSKADSSQLETLKSFMAGEITHFFVESYYPKISTWGDEVFNRDSYRHEFDSMKLVTLYGRSNGDLEFKISEYSDGSGSATKVFPCKSYAEALQLAQDTFNKKAEEYLNTEKSSINLEEWRKIEGLIIPEAVSAKSQTQIQKSKDARIAQLQAEIEKLKQ